MKIKLFAFILFVSFVPVSGCIQEKDNWQSHNYETGEFTKIRLEGGFKVTLIQGDTCMITAKASDEDVFDKLKVINNDGEVIVKMKASIFDYRQVNLYITFKSLEKLNVKGSVSLNTEGFVELEEFEVKLEGGAKVAIDTKAKKLNISGEGGFLAELKGVTDNLEVSVAGAGHVSATELQARKVNFSVAGFGTGSVFATDTLYAKIEGAGKVSYKGKPEIIQNISGLGSVKPVE